MADGDVYKAIDNAAQDLDNMIQHGFNDADAQKAGFTSVFEMHNTLQRIADTALELKRELEVA